MKRFLRITLLVALGTLILIQLVPYGRDHTNPSSRIEPAWHSPEVRDLAQRACFDCHSNETKWPWYSHVAPVSWLVQRDVEKGRHEMNFSEWDRPQDEAHEAAEMVREGKMPLSYYLPTHPDAKLTPAEKETLIAGLVAMFGDEEHGGGENHADE